jgi:cytochrome b6-f complex iron-sulfur subunit
VSQAVEGGLELALTQNPSLAESGGQVSVTHGEGRILVVRGDGDAILAVDQRCPHRGCSVSWKAEEAGFICPCHGSAFDADGALRKGPAKEGLRSYPARLEGERVLVELT